MNPMGIMLMVPNPNMTSPADGMMMNPNFVPLGDDNGAGFGWEDMMIVKVGADYRKVENLQFRCGFSYGKQPIPIVPKNIEWRSKCLNLPATNITEQR